jgi:uncharacterized protein (DUF2062 family)
VARPDKLPLAIRLRRRLRAAWRRLVRERSSPAQIGVAVFWGVVVGCSPFYGFQNLIAIGSSTLFRLNRVAVVLAAQITMPPLNVLIVFASFQVGHRLRSGTWLDLAVGEVRDMPLRDLAGELAYDFALGAFAVGVALAIPISIVVAKLVARSRRAHDPSKELTESDRAGLEERLDFLSGTFRHYGGFKSKLDPVYPLALAALAGRRDVVDLGAGMGLLAALHAGRDPEARVRAVEWDPKKVAAARVLCDDLPRTEIVEADARTYDVTGADAVALVDVLHYLPIDEQRAWLSTIAASLGADATIVVRELDSSAEKGKLAAVIDAWMVRLGWNRGAGVHAWPIRDMVSVLEGAGFTTTVVGAGKGAFKANALVVATRGGTASASTASSPDGGAAAALPAEAPAATRES